jgi:hypothetical protein
LGQLALPALGLEQRLPERLVLLEPWELLEPRLPEPLEPWFPLEQLEPS